MKYVDHLYNIAVVIGCRYSEMGILYMNKNKRMYEIVVFIEVSWFKHVW